MEKQQEISEINLLAKIKRCNAPDYIWDNLQEKILGITPQVSLKQLISAAAILLILFSTSFYLVQNRKQQSNTDNYNLEINTDIYA